MFAEKSFYGLVFVCVTVYPLTLAEKPGKLSRKGEWKQNNRLQNEHSVAFNKLTTQHTVLLSINACTLGHRKG